MLPPEVFSSLSRLATLIISYNKLQCVQSRAFSGLKNLRILSLHGNDISMIPEDAFEDRSSITHLALGSNPFYCNCDLKWLSEWVKTDFIEPGIAKCAAPMTQKDKLLLTSPSEHFQCLGKSTKIDISVLCHVLGTVHFCYYTYEFSNDSCISLF